MSQPATPPNSFPANYTEDDIPSFNAITDALQDTIPPCMTSYQISSYSHLGSSSKLVKSGFFNANTPFLYSNSPLRPFKINSPQPEISFGTPLNDPALLKLMEEFEAKSKRNQIEAGKKQFQNFSSAKIVQQPNYLQFQQVIFSTPVQIEFYKTMTAALPVLDSSQRIFQVNEVWVDQKTLTISLRPGCWMNPHSLDCYSKMLNTDQLIRGRQGLIPNTDVIRHIVQREDMAILMRPMLDHSDPICRDILSEARVGFRLEIANFVHLPCSMISNGF